MKNIYIYIYIVGYKPGRSHLNARRWVFCVYGSTLGLWGARMCASLELASYVHRRDIAIGHTITVGCIPSCLYKVQTPHPGPSGMIAQSRIAQSQRTRAQGKGHQHIDVAYGYGCGIIPCGMQGMTPLVCVKTGTVQALSFKEEECLTAHHMHELTLQVLLQEASEASCCGPCAVELCLSVGPG